ncbi:hypothetical protein RI129_000596 [Pyrocoelia pectoralis]|uniref:DUF7041 domain-containing protein n=1 Tax=Pyrocoelia pectoralis TaxID=417401 RepID=A0AAN7ZP09_9COLE
MIEDSQQNTYQQSQNRDQRIAAVNVKLPPFWRKDVNIWFLQIESQFFTARITTEKTKYHHVLGSLESDVVSLISDFFKKELSSTPYSDLKARLIEQFEESNNRKATKLLNEMSLGNKKPSTLLREMRSLAGSQIKDDFLKTIFLQRLPDNINAILTATGDSLELDKLATLADKVMETTVPTNNMIAPVSSNKLISSGLEQRLTALESANGLEQRIASLEKAITSLDARLRSRSNSRSNDRGRSQSSKRKNVQQYDQCWYHYKYGTKARKCVAPCNFDTKQENLNLDH